jgi:two-component system response regulator YesN
MNDPYKVEKSPVDSQAAKARQSERSVYRLVIADDEPLSRYALHTMILRLFPNKLRVKEFDTGAEAVAHAKEHPVDIAVLDIKMPGIDGIEAAVQMLREQPALQVLLLTAHERFAFAKRAIDAGVRGYILKPPQEERLRTKLREVMTDVERRRSVEERDENIQRRVGSITPYVEHRVVSYLSSGVGATEEIDAYIDFLKREFRGGVFLCISCSNAEPSESIEKIRAYLRRFNGLVATGPYGGVTCFLPLGPEETVEKKEEEAMTAATGIVRRMNTGECDGPFIGVGPVETTLSSLSGAYSAALAALRNVGARTRVARYDESRERLPASPIGLRNELHSVEDELVQAVNLEDLDRARELLDKLAIRVASGVSSLQRQRDVFFEVLVLLKRRAERFGDPGINMENRELLLAFESVADAGELSQQFLSRAYRMLADIEIAKTERPGPLFKRIQEYLEACPCREISLEDAANWAGVTPQYLSRYFKGHVGVKFIEHVTGARISEAKKLLTTTEMAVPEIGQAVGYSDPNYFTRVFRKHTGYSPHEFRARC